MNEILFTIDLKGTGNDTFSNKFMDQRERSQGKLGSKGQKKEVTIIYSDGKKLEKSPLG